MPHWLSIMVPAGSDRKTSVVRITLERSPASNAGKGLSFDEVCDETFVYANEGVCNDLDTCSLEIDCIKCQQQHQSDGRQDDVSGGACDDSCADANDGYCDDGVYILLVHCGLDTDCTDCGSKGQRDTVKRKTNTFTERGVKIQVTLPTLSGISATTILTTTSLTKISQMTVSYIAPVCSRMVSTFRLSRPPSMMRSIVLIRPQ